MDPPSCRPGRACQCPISFRRDVSMYHQIAPHFYGTDHRYRCRLLQLLLRCFSFQTGCSCHNETTEWLVCRCTSSSNISKLLLESQNPVGSPLRHMYLSLAHVSMPPGRIIRTRTFMRGRRGEPASMECRHSMPRRGISRPYPPRRGPVGRASSSAIPAEEPQIYREPFGQSSASHASAYVDYPRISTHCRRGFPRHPLLSLVFRPHSSAGNTSVSIPTAPIAGCHGLSMWKLLRHFLRSTACTRSVVPSQRWNSASIVTSVGAGRVHLVVAVERSVPCHKQQSLRKQTRHWTERVSPESGTANANSRRLVADHHSDRKRKYRTKFQRI